MGDMLPKAAYSHVTDLRLRIKLPVPFIAYLTVTESRCFLCIRQSFEDPSYRDALEEVIGELL